MRRVVNVIAFSERKGLLSFSVHVVPRASRSEIVGEYEGALRVRIAAPPVDGAANDELIRTLARAFHVPRSAIAITRGQSSRVKQISIVGAGPHDLARILNAESAGDTT